MENLSKDRRFIFISVVALSLLGLLVIYSSSCIFAFKVYKNPAYFFFRQAVFLLISIGVFFISLLVDGDILRRYCKEGLLVIIFLLIAVLFIGKEAGGAKRWLYIAGWHFQPSELLKVGLLLYGADYLARKKGRIKDFLHGLMPLLFVVGVVSFFVLLEPDMGTVVFWLAWVLIILFIAGARRSHLVSLVFMGFILFVVLVRTHPYRLMRLLSYLDPWRDAQGSGFQIIQSQISFGEGGFWGVGLGAGRQKFMFLPAAHTDFIFSVIAEEFGFVGSLLVLGTYFAIFTRMFLVGRRLKDDFYRYFSLGLSVIFALEVIINVGVATGFFPTKGMALPFMSYGGTTLVVHYFILGLFFNFTRTYETMINMEDKSSTDKL